MSKNLLISSFFSLFLLSSCGTFVFSSNVDPRNFREHFRSSLVDEYSNEDMASFSSYEILGLVEGIDCQVNELYPVPREGTARRQMLEKASDLGATGVASVKCVRVEATEACIAEYTCYAQAVKVLDQK
jgi:RcsF protein